MKMNQIKKILETVALIAPLSAVAASGDKPEFSEVDSDDDGVVTVEEAVEAGVPEQEAKRQDVDGDGELSEADWEFIRVNQLE